MFKLKKIEDRFPIEVGFIFQYGGQYYKLYGQDQETKEFYLCSYREGDSRVSSIGHTYTKSFIKEGIATGRYRRVLEEEMYKVPIELRNQT